MSTERVQTPVSPGTSTLPSHRLFKSSLLSISKSSTFANSGKKLLCCGGFPFRQVIGVKALEVFYSRFSKCQMRVATSSTTSWSCVTSKTVPSYF
jgi:hypothetical protein